MFLTIVESPCNAISSKKWSEYYTCKECEEEVNRKGHLTKLQEVVHVDNVKYISIKSEQNIILPILKHV